MKTKIQIKSISGKILFEYEKKNNTIEQTLIEGIKEGANLRGANLGDADLGDADLGGADLGGAYLRDANLRDAYLRDANLRDAYLRGANLRGAYLRGAYLRGANLGGAYLRGADLGGADLGGADLGGAYLRDANLRDAYLRGANLRGAKDISKIKHYFQIIPEEGAFIAWKKGANKHLIKLEIPERAKRHNSLGGRKCRAEFVKVLDIRNSKGHKVKECHNGTHENNRILYRIGEITYADSYDPDPLNECSHGIHFFLTKQEAKDW